MEQKLKNVSAQSNEIRNQYVIQQIMNATLDLLTPYPLVNYVTRLKWEERPFIEILRIREG